MDDAIIRYAAEHDEVWHAGDWGAIEVFDKLSAVADLRGVYGNIDGAEIRAVVPVELNFTCEEVSVYITHIAGYPGKYKSFALKRIQELKPGLVVCGHSHILKVMYDKELKHLHINPGAIGISGFHKVRTMISLEIDKKEMRNLRVIEFSK